MLSIQTIRTANGNAVQSPNAGTSFRVAFREWFGLRPAPAELLIALFNAKGDLVPSPQLAKAAGVSVGAVQFHVSDLRAALETEALDCERGRGYRLTEVGLSECRAALWTMGEELRRAS